MSMVESSRKGHKEAIRGRCRNLGVSLVARLQERVC